MAEEARVEPETQEEFLGIPVTEEGKARWRERLDRLDAEWNKQRWDELRKRYGLS